MVDTAIEVPSVEVTPSSPLPIEASDANTKSSSTKGTYICKVKKAHSDVPVLRKIPLRALGIILLVAAVNGVVWAAAGIVLHFHPSLVSTAVLSYTLGLRHALDADHISAIDLMTRRLLATGQKAVTVGTFFSLGHSTIVIITSIVVAGTAAAVSSKFDNLGTVGGIIGSSVSSAFLILLGIMNGYILHKLVQQMQKALRNRYNGEEAWKIEGGGVLFRILKGLFKIINRPWKMYPLGVLFGLGFDTSSEIALLGLSSIQAAKGTSIWVIMIFPVLFTAGMCLIDTIDGALMLSLYIQPAEHFLKSSSESAPLTLLSEDPEQPISRNPRDPIAFLYYSIVLTSLTVVVAIVIGVLQLLTMIVSAADPKGKFWEGVEIAGEYYDVIGASICGLFLIFAGLSVVVYPRWRKWIEKKAQLKYGGENVSVEEGDSDPRNSDTTTEPTGIITSVSAERPSETDALIDAREGRAVSRSTYV